MLAFYILCLFFSPRHQSAETVFITSGNKISMSYNEGGSTLASAANKDDRFAMNGQMFRMPGYQPVGLYIESGKKKNNMVEVNNPKTNFGITPQMIFYIDTNNKAGLVETKQCNTRAYKYATQISPLLLKNGEVHSKIKNFKGLCANRNGIGLKKDGTVVFLFAPQNTTLPEFAEIFKKQGCVTAAYVDGFVSECWTPGKAGSGTFGVVIKSK